MNNKIAINPVTIASVGGLECVLGRRGTGASGGRVRRMVRVTVTCDRKPVCEVEVDEPGFVDAMGHLFSDGSLAQAHLTPLPPADATPPTGKSEIITPGDVKAGDVLIGTDSSRMRVLDVLVGGLGISMPTFHVVDLGTGRTKWHSTAYAPRAQMKREIPDDGRTDQGPAAPAAAGGGGQG